MDLTQFFPHNDPFLSRYLSVPKQPTILALGLRGLLDAYNFREETTVLLFFHLICPNIDHNEFSKTEINHLPFKKTAGETLHTIFAELSGHERFIPEQLYAPGRVSLIPTFTILCISPLLVFDQVFPRLVFYPLSCGFCPITVVRCQAPQKEEDCIAIRACWYRTSNMASLMRPSFTNFALI
jgi:hypothetical protein